MEVKNDELLDTGDRPLLEATFDSHWGCGLTLTARKLKQGEWHGKNYLGIILAECRFEIRREKAIQYQQMNVTTGAMLSHTSPQQSSHAPTKQTHHPRSSVPPHQGHPHNRISSQGSPQKLSLNQVLQINRSHPINRSMPKLSNLCNHNNHNSGP